MEVVSGSQQMIAQMNPVLDSTTYCFAVITPNIAPVALGSAIATFREAEGVSAIIPFDLAVELGEAGPEFSRITLQVHSDLTGVGLTAAVSTVLAASDIACNVVAAFHHDHVFVPIARAEEALLLLHDLASATDALQG